MDRMNRMDEEVDIERTPPSEELLRECACLYSGHYGTWAVATPEGGTNTIGHRVRTTSSLLRRLYLPQNTAFLVTARTRACSSVRHGERVLVGYACVQGFRVDPPLSYAAVWITQLVVKTEHRRRGIATRICRSAIDREGSGSGESASASVACIASSNPYSVRALEVAAGSRCCARFIREWYHVCASSSGVPYLRGRPFHSAHCTVDTAFYVDSSELTENESVRRLDEAGKWSHPHRRTEPLPLGHEYVALVRTSYGRGGIDASKDALFRYQNQSNNDADGQK
jgi:GNAT superfamily N-acetyltransferase